MRRILPLFLAVSALAACDDDDPLTPVPLMSEFEVTIENLTSGQPMTPPLAAIHTADIALWERGAAASEGIREIAENGNLAPLEMAVMSATAVTDYLVAVGSGDPPLMAGESRTFAIESTDGAGLFSFVSMLICTNDGFTGVSSVALPGEIGESVTAEGISYDAGSEMNTEAWEDLVPPCGPLTGEDSGGAGTGMSNPALAEGGVVTVHPGIVGTGDLTPGIHDWNDPAVRVTVRRVS